MGDNHISNKRIAKNSTLLSIRMVIVLLISLYTTRVLLQELGVVDYGVYNVVCGFVLMFGFLNISMSNGIQRFLNYEYGVNGVDGANKVYCTSICIQLLLSTIVVLFLESFGMWYLHYEMVIPAERINAAEWIFHFSMLVFVLGIIQAPYMAAVTAHEEFNFYAIMSIVDVVLKLLIVFFLRVLPNNKLVIYGALIAIVSVVNFILYFCFCKRKFCEITFKKNKIDKILFKKMLAFSGWNLFGSFSGVMEVQGINLVLNYFFGPIVNAARGVAAQINAGVQSFVSNVTIPVRPQVTQSYARGDIERTLSLTFGVSKLGSAIILTLSLPVAIEIDYILKIWLGDNIPNHTATFTILVLATQMVNSLNAAISNVVHATGIMRDYQLWSSIVRLLSIPTSILLIINFDIPEFALMSVFFFSSLSHFIGLFIVRKLLNFSVRYYLISVVWRIFLVFVICVFIVYIPHVFISECFIRLVIVCSLSIIVVGFTIYYVAFDEVERKMSIELISPLLKFLKGHH